MDFNNILKQAQTLKADFEKKQAEFAKLEFEATSGGGLVKVVLNGKGKALTLALDPKLFEDNDVNMTQDLILAAFNNAKDQVDEGNKEMMSGAASGLNVPGLDNIF